MTIKTTKYADLGLERPVAVIGFPGAGLVSSIAPNFCIGQLSMEPIAGMASPEMPPYCLIANDMAMPPVRFYGRKGTGKTGRDTIVCMSEYSPKPEFCYELAHAILDYLRRMGCEDIICLEGLPRSSPEDKMLICGSGPGARKLMKRSKVTVMDGGMVRGLTGVLLYDGPSAGMNVVSIMCPASQTMPDPGAAAEFFGPLNRMIPSFKVDKGPLLEEADQIRKRIEEQEAESKDETAQYYG